MFKRNMKVFCKHKDKQTIILSSKIIIPHKKFLNTFPNSMPRKELWGVKMPAKKEVSMFSIPFILPP